MTKFQIFLLASWFVVQNFFNLIMNVFLVQVPVYNATTITIVKNVNLAGYSKTDFVKKLIVSINSFILMEFVMIVKIIVQSV